MSQNGFEQAYRLARRIAVGAVGGSVLIVGLLLIVLPGPAFVVIPIGLSILAVEFAFARRWLRIVAIRTGMRPAEDARSPSEAKWAGVEYRPCESRRERDGPNEAPAGPGPRQVADPD